MLGLKQIYINFINNNVKIAIFIIVQDRTMQNNGEAFCNFSTISLKPSRFYATKMLVTFLIHKTLSSTYFYLNDQGRV